MKNNRKLFVLALAATLLLVAGGTLYAWPYSPFVSPQRSATATQFWSSPDLYISPGGYKAVDFDKWFGVVSFYNADLGGTGGTQMAQLGFATKFGELYAAAYYGGNAWNIQQHTYNKQSENFFGNTKEMRTYTSIPEIRSNTPENDAAILIGIADMGFRLSYRTDYMSRKLDEDFMVGAGAAASFYKSFFSEYGNLYPEIAWGMTKDLTARGIKPHVYVGLDFFRDYRSNERYTTAANATTGLVVDKSNNSFTLNATVAAGGFSLYNNDKGFDFGVDLWYVLEGLTLYNNEYNYTDASLKNQIKTYSGKYDGTGFAEESSNSHVVLPYLYVSWEGDRLSLAAELDLALGFGGDKNTGMAIKTGSTDGTLVAHGTDAKTSYISFIPELYLGLQWELVREKFFLNAGGTIGFGSLKKETTKSIANNQGSKLANSDTIEITNDFGGATTELTLGVTLNATENLGIQARAGVFTSNSVNTFNDTFNGLGTFQQILVTLKF